MKLKSMAAFLVLAVASLFGQAQTSSRRPVIFAVLDDGRTLEPIAYVSGKKLESAVDGASEEAVLSSFHSNYFKSKTKYELIFGGTKAGSVTIKASDPASECSKHTAQVFTTSVRAKLKGNVMALATNASGIAPGDGMRRTPTVAERTEIEALVRSTFAKNKIGAAVLKNLKYQNLTAVDVNRDGTPEFVGSYWVAPTGKSRALLFLIAEKGKSGKYALSLTDFSRIAEADTMGDDITAVDGGVYHELLLDLFDYDADGTSEIFTYSASFEGAGFTVYRRTGGRWVKDFEASNYRCAY
jgi:hypothetical protein